MKIIDCRVQGGPIIPCPPRRVFDDYTVICAAQSPYRFRNRYLNIRSQLILCSHEHFKMYILFYIYNLYQILSR